MISKVLFAALLGETSNTELLDISPLKNNIEKLVGDYNNYSDLLKLTAGADVVMHISNIHQSLSVLRASIENKVAKLVMVHTTGVYSKFKMASSEYKEIEKEIEKTINTIKTTTHNDMIDVIILRPTMIFGDLCDHNISKFIRMVDKFTFMPEINRGQGKIRPVNARDLAKAYYTVCMSEKRLPELYYDLSGERSLTLHELFDLSGRMYNCPPAKSRDDGKPICPVCGVVEALEAASIPEEEQRAIVELAEKTENGRVKPITML